MIIIHLIFFTLLSAFIFVKSDDSSRIEEAYAKKIALILDAAKPGMEVSIDMQKAIQENNPDYVGKIVSIEGNLVTVKLNEKGGYSYSFFNDVELTKKYFYPSDGNEFNFIVEEKQ